MLKFKRKKIYEKYNLTNEQMSICEKLYKFKKRNGFYYYPSLQHNKTLFQKVLKEIFKEVKR